MALCTWAHPRSREEHSSTARISKPPPGSSPLARGTRHSRTTARVSPGLIPARAGNTHRGSPGYLSCWAHPRSRGEHVFQAFGEVSEQGSSPLARGTPENLVWATGGEGLIPARAGNINAVFLFLNAGGAHPRSRGEHGGATPYPTREVGSSPLARGTPFASKQGMQANGLIPARAGNTFLPGAR